MRLSIIGAGVVGRATGEGFKRFGHSVVYSDLGDNPAVEADLHFVCTPEDAVPGVVQELAEKLVFPEGMNGAEKLVFPEGMNGQVVIRSSVPPGTTRGLAEQYPRLRLFHNPEFLREATAEQDFLHADRAIIGVAYGGPCYALDELYRAMQVPVYYCSSTVSEMVKLVTNAYLATNISFWNEMLGMFRALNVNGHTVARLVALDPRVSHYGAYQFGKPYGGKCLPKDVQQLLDLRDRSGGSQWLTPVLEAVQAMNRGLGGT